MLTKPDLDQVREIVKEEVKGQTKHLPNKDEFYGAMDKISGELQGIREEIVGMKSTYDDHEERISSLEAIHPSGQHPS